MANLVNWTDFERNSKNKTGDFESLCRLIFKYFYLKNKDAILVQTENNPGIETDPVIFKGEKMGFQAKYFSGNISYEDLYCSALTTCKFYQNNLDKIIIFCNKNISKKAKRFLEMEKLFSDSGIEIILCCDKSILDIINSQDIYTKIRELFFGNISISNEWFSKKLKQSLEDLSPRYESGFHIKNESVERALSSMYRTCEVSEHLATLISDAFLKLKNIEYFPEPHIKKVEEIISNFKIPKKPFLEESLNWFTGFCNILSIIEKEHSDLYKLLSDPAIENDDKKKDNLLKRIYDYRKVISIIKSFDFTNDNYLRFLQKNCLLIEGDAGYGKSHILGYFAEKIGISDSGRTLLLLGQKFVANNVLDKQIMDVIGLDCSFDSLLNICEAKGELDGTITVLMIDAINESSQINIWKPFLNEIINKINSFKFIRLIFSNRTTYRENLFDEIINQKIETGNLPIIEVTGFQNNLEEAVYSYFTRYSIPTSVNPFLNREFENPLFLKMYCMSYDPNNSFGSETIYSTYSKYLDKEERLICSTKKIDYIEKFGNKVFQEIGRYFYLNDTNHISFSELMKLVKDIPNSYDLITGFLHSKTLSSYRYENDPQIFINFETFSDFLVAQIITNIYDNADELKLFLRDTYLKLNEKGDFSKRFVEGRFLAISILAREKYGVEIVDCLNQEKMPRYRLNHLVNQYIDYFRLRRNQDINAEDFDKILFPLINTNGNWEHFLELLLKLSGRNCSMNAEYLTKLLFNLNLTQRDYLWTIYINKHFFEGEAAYNIVNFFLNTLLQKTQANEIPLFCKTLVWFLSSSNRTLRDKASRAITKLIRNNFHLAIMCLESFINVDDPYIISRLFGCIYGAIIQYSNLSEYENEISIISDFIFKNVFGNITAFQDILLRDYALNILEFFKYKGAKLSFDIQKCRPPYASSDIPDINLDSLKKEYKDTLEKPNGLNRIRTSLSPSFKIGDFCSGFYGDFGRYVFESSLTYFHKVDKAKVFKFAFDFIINGLGYKENLFSDFDCSLGYGRGRDSSLERIGKKYEWIAMYHVLAIVADNYDYKEEYSDISYSKYEGTWRPFIRDFDPSLTLYFDERVYEHLGFFLKRKEYKNWRLQNDDWANIDDAFDFKDQVKMVDNNGKRWFALYFNSSDDSSKNYDEERQSVWRSSAACLIKKNEAVNFVNKIKTRSFWGRWFQTAEITSKYNIFLQEYCWSPAYKADMLPTDFCEATIQVGQKVVRKKCNEFKIREIPNQDSKGDLPSLSYYAQLVEKDVIEPIYETIGNLSICCQRYLWESSTDYGKDQTISINLPSKYLIEKLGLHQTYDGIWTKNGEIVCLDFRLVKNSNVDGLYIREEALRNLLKEGYCLIWFGIGEKQHLYGLGNKQSWSELSSLIFESDEKTLEEIKIVNNNKVG